MKTTEYGKTYQEAVETYGKEAQLWMVVEETSELLKEICKSKRGKNNRREIAEEIADVQIMLYQAEIIFDIAEDVAEAIDEKTTRLQRRMDAARVLREHISRSDKRASVEIEGGPHNWWYVCEECHTVVNMMDKTCPECGAELDWSTATLNWSDKK